MKAGSITRDALFTGLIDYAGLFPPSKLEMAAAVRNYASYLSGENAWMLGRFLVPAARLEEFAETAASCLAENAWKVGVLGKPEGLSQDRGFVIDAVELKVEHLGEIQAVSGPNTYVEFPVALPLESALEAIKKAGARAKIRTGGLTAAAFPPVEQVARFLSLCHHAGVAFKATAGLHHAVRGVYALTGEPTGERGVMHGFLNLFLAATMIFTGASQQEAVRLLEEQSPGTFRFHEDSVRWHSHRFGAEQIRETRQNFAISFGSCSFEEPLQELVALGIL